MSCDPNFLCMMLLGTCDHMTDMQHLTKQCKNDLERHVTPCT